MVGKPPAGLVERSEDLFRRTGRQAAYVVSAIKSHHVLHFGICVLLIVIHIFLLPTPFLRRFEYFFIDFFFRHRPVLAVHPAIVYIDMAEDSIQTIGRWPWPRHYHAALTHILTEWKAKAVVFDVVFSEESDPSDDNALREAIKESGNVYLPVVKDRKEGQDFWLRSLPKLEEHARGFGHINITPDVDGTVRHIKPFLKVVDEVHPHLALRVAYDYLGIPNQVASFASSSEFLVNWVGPWKDTFHHFSYVDVIKSYAMINKGEKPIVPPADIEGKICIIGLTAFGLSDIKVNPLEPAYPGPGIHGNVINNILMNQFVRPASFRTNAFCLVIVGLTVSILLMSSRNVWAFSGSLAIGFGWSLISYLIFLHKGIWLYVAHEILLIIILFVFSAALLMVVKNRELMRLFKLATQDGLTGLYVIRYFRILLNQAADEAIKRKRPISVILGDIDHFKNINDTYGHACGDMVLKGVARVTQSAVLGKQESKKDVKQSHAVARYGGEEIIVMLRDCNLQEAAFKIAERIRKSIEQEQFVWEEKRVAVTISLGVSTLHFNESVPDMMVRRSDEALYRAKEGGRNRVCVEDLGKK